MKLNFSDNIEFYVDKTDPSVIYAEFTEEEGIGVAVRNRLYKSAGNKITKV